MKSEIEIFAELDAADFLKGRVAKMVHRIENEEEAYIAGVEEGSYTSHLVDAFSCEPVKIEFDGMWADQSEEMIPAHLFPHNFSVRHGESYKKDVLHFHLPYGGDSSQLQLCPSPRLLWSHRVRVHVDSISFDIVAFSANAPDSIRRTADDIVNNVRIQHGHLVKQIQQYNDRLEAEARAAINQRKQRLHKSSKLLEGLGLPIRKRNNVPETFAVPSPARRKQITISRPEVTATLVKPEPTLSQSIYLEILKLVHGVGRQFERMPSTYAGKHEEDLRDHLLLFLEPNFEGSATGETFNKSGKTDILLRHDGANVFVAECKWWSGKSGFLKGVDQLLSYLTWRDSKTALIVFVDNADFTRTFNTLEATVSSHACFVRRSADQDQGWMNCEFHLPEDPGRVVKVAVMAYHLPRSDK